MAAWLQVPPPGRVYFLLLDREDAAAWDIDHPRQLITYFGRIEERRVTSTGIPLETFSYLGLYFFHYPPMFHLDGNVIPGGAPHAPMAGVIPAPPLACAEPAFEPPPVAGPVHQDPLMPDPQLYGEGVPLGEASVEGAGAAAEMEDDAVVPIFEAVGGDAGELELESEGEEDPEEFPLEDEEESWFEPDLSEVITLETPPGLIYPLTLPEDESDSSVSSESSEEWDGDMSDLDDDWY